MMPEQIQALAQAIAEQHLLQLGKPFLFGILITAVSAAVAAYLGAYLRERGKNFATKQDFDGLLEQLRKTTEATAHIKTQIEHADWLKREATSIKRQKAEELIIAMYDARDYLQSISRQVFFGKEEEIAYSPGAKATMLAGLYFPELTKEGIVFGAHCSWIGAKLRDFVKVRVELEPHPFKLKAERDKVTERFKEMSRLLLELTSFIEISIANQMAEIAGAPPPYQPPISPSPEIERMWAADPL